MSEAQPIKIASLVFIKDGKVLMVSKRDGELLSLLPGGKIKRGETPLKAAVREAKEELDLDVTSLVKIFSNNAGRTFCTTFLVTGYTGLINPEEGLQVGWVEVDKLPEVGVYRHYYSRVTNILHDVTNSLKSLI